MQVADLASKQIVNNIVSKGGQALYDVYVSQKIPNHTNQNIDNYLCQTMNGAYAKHSYRNNITKDTAPQSLIIDKNMSNKIQKRPKSQQSKLPKKLQVSGLLNKTQKSTNKKIGEIFSQRYQSERVHRSNVNKKPNFCFKISCQKYSPQDFAQQNSFRKSKIKRDHQNQLKQCQLKKQNQEKIWRKQKLYHKIEQLNSLGLKYALDDNGQIIGPSDKQIKEAKHPFPEKKNKNKSQNHQKVLNIKYQTLDIASVNRYNYQQEKQVTGGRKRGFVSTKFYKKLKMTDREFNNQNSRQVTAIPFLNLSSGITIIQQQKNVVASRSKQPTKTRDDYVKESRTSSFKSYLPEQQKISDYYNTISIDRPYTTAQCDRNKRTADTRSMKTSSARKSILWRPQTTSQKCRLSINNMDLAKQFVKE